MFINCTKNSKPLTSIQTIESIFIMNVVTGHTTVWPFLFAK
jgi:hypothetical protein